MASTFTEERSAKATLRIRELLKDMPVLVADYIRSIETSTSALTRLNYVYDMRLFLRFLHEEQVDFGDKEPRDFNENDFGRVSLRQMEMYQSYLVQYVSADSDKSETPIVVRNANVSISRKIASLRSFYKYLFKHGYIQSNEAAKLSMPKITEKAFVYLERDEINKMLDAIDSGEGFSDRQKAHLEHVRTRDHAIFLMLTGCGIRESELVGLNIEDIDLNESKFLVTRKGGNQAILYLPESVASALKDWMRQREEIIPLPGHESALFLSRERARISVRAVQVLVKKYASVSLTLNQKKIAPHRLRATYATNLYRKTNDIYAVSKTLGHKSIETVRKYARESDDTFRKASQDVDWV